MSNRHVRGKWLARLSVVLVVSFLVLAACGSDSDGQDLAESNNQDQPEQKEEQAGEEKPREITHAMETTVLTGEPQKVVTLFQGANDAAVAFGITPIGIVESWVQQPIYEYLRSDLEGIEIVGLETQPNLEAISILQPDLIIANKGRHEDIYAQLKGIAPTIVIEEIFDWKETIELMGQALNREEDAQRLLADWEEQVEAFKAAMADQFPIEVSVVNFRADHARIYYTGFAGSILNELGFSRPESHQVDEWGAVFTDKESIPEMDADIIFIFMEEDDAVQQTYAEWTEHPLWQALDAVQQGRVYMVDEVTWNMAGGYLSAQMMLEALYRIFELEQPE